MIRDLSLRIEPGEVVALMGRNGAGKSTLLRAIAGWWSHGGARPRLQPAGRWCRKHRATSSSANGSATSCQAPRVKPRSAAVGLAGAVDSDPRDLSGGERQRLALAIAMAGRTGEGLPGLICLDEPTRGMDTARKHELAGRLRDLAGTGSAVLVATHDVEFASTFARRVVLMGEGEVLADGTAEEILSGGWYFATEVARALGAGGPITPERGAELLRERARAGER